MKTLRLILSMLVVAIAVPAFASVVVTSPLNGSSVSPSVSFSASASTSTCSRGVAAMGVFVDDALYYVSDGINLNKQLSLPTGKHRVVVQEWDYCGGATNTALNLNVNGQSGVSVTYPIAGSTISTPAAVVASATTDCPLGVAKMGIYVNDGLAYVVDGASLNTQLPLVAGAQKVVVQSWDHCGGSSSTPLNVTVAGSTITNLQASSNWNQWGELAPIYDICTFCPGISWSMLRNVSDISLGNATKFTIAGLIPYSDVLWSNPVLGQGAPANMADASHKLLPTLHNFVLDQYVYVTNFAVTQDLEFDINMYAGGVGMEWGTECNHLDDGAWDIWDNVNRSWVATSIPCVLNDKAWNRITLQVQRQSNNDLLYQSIAVNGVVYPINKVVAPYAVPSGWWGMTVNYQMDGNYSMATNSTYVDKMNFTYW